MRLDSRPLPSGQNVQRVVHQTRLILELAEEIRGFVISCLNDWSQDEVEGILQSILVRLGREIEDEVEIIGREIYEISIGLTGLKEDLGSDGSVVKASERVISAFTHLAFGDLSAASTDAQEGWRAGPDGMLPAIETSIRLGIGARTNAALSAKLVIRLRPDSRRVQSG